jgi:predicted PilT family ATPase
VVRIEGPPDAVQKAKLEFLEMIKKVENERSKDIIIEQKYHSNLIGKNGKNLNELRAKFNDIQIQIPNQEEKSDVVTLRGNKLDVEKCFKHLQQMIKEMQESAYQDELHIFKQFHKMLIGRHGAFIRKIRDDTNTRIDVPSGDSDSDSILIVGRQENVFKARKLIEDKVKELLKIEEDFIDIPHQLHTALIGRGGAIIKQIRKECGGVIINFPPEQTASSSDRITLKGPRDDIEKAKQELSKMAKQKNDMNYTEEIIVKAEFHRFLVGKKGTSINSMRDKHNVRIILPTAQQQQQQFNDNNNNNAPAAPNPADIIICVGKEENVKAVRLEIETIVKNLQEQITDQIHVDSKWHKNFTAKRAKLINTISNENCNVNISFPKQNASPSDSNKVVIKGPKDAVESAKKRIAEIVYDLENHVTIECCIPQKHHVNLIGKKGAKSSQLSDEFRVEIQFPAKSLTAAAAASDGPSPSMNGSTDQVNKSIYIFNFTLYI